MDSVFPLKARPAFLPYLSYMLYLFYAHIKVVVAFLVVNFFVFW